jgi:hypothetical protein
MHNRNPKVPVIKLPYRNTVLSQFTSAIIVQSVDGSPQRRTTGSSMSAEPTFVHHASWMVELLQYGREVLIRTAWNAMNKDERTPYARDTIEGVAMSGTLEDGATPRKNPPVTMALARMTLRLGIVWVFTDETMMVSGRTRPLAIWKKEASTPRRHRVLNTSLRRVSIGI